MFDLLAQRRAGVLLHVSSLPGGVLGPDAFAFVDFLAAAGCSVWQTLPLGPVDEYGSPYCLRSAHAADPRLLDTAALRERPELPAAMAFDALHTDSAAAYRSFAASADATQTARFAAFVRARRDWLYPYSLFELCAWRFGQAPWWEWPAEFRNKHRASLAALRAGQRDRWRGLLLQQFAFELQWSALKSYANGRGVQLFGDLPFYVDRNSVDVWWNPGEFLLDAEGRPQFVAGVPPDYFNEDGQLWGNPLYDWDAMAGNGFAWWTKRLDVQLARFDLLRIDHFRAVESYWAIPAQADTARDGYWRPGGGAPFLARLMGQGQPLPLVAEDLGMITDAVRALRDRFGLPGMAVLQFAFDGSPDNPHLPRNCPPNSVIYTGTHDNDTTVSWYSGLDAATRAAVNAAVPGELRVPDSLIDAVFASAARLAVIPMQDLLGLGGGARLNTPGSVAGNWRWRMSRSDLTAELASRCLARARRFARTGA